MKNIMASPINQLIFKLLKDNHTSNTKNKNIKNNDENIEIFKIKDQKFLYILKKLSNITHEYLINFYSSVPLDEDISNIKMKGNSYFDILYTLIKSKNSISIAENYEKIFNNYLNFLNLKNKRDVDKLQIFYSLIKFLYKNSKENLKKFNIKGLVINKIIKFFDEIKTESIILSILNFVKTKYLKNKKISKKIFKFLISKFSDIKSKNVYHTLIKNNFEIIQKNLILNISNYDLISKEYTRKIEKTSFFFTEIFNKFNELNSEYKNIFELNFFCFLKDTNNKLNFSNFDYSGNLEILQKILYLSSFDLKTYNYLFKYFSNSLEYNKDIKKLLNHLKFCVINEIIPNEDKVFHLNNLVLFEKIEILFLNKIQIKKDNLNESFPTNIFIKDSYKKNLQTSLLNLFSYENVENKKKIEFLETLMEFSDDKIKNKLQKIFLKKKINQIKENLDISPDESFVDNELIEKNKEPCSNINFDTNQELKFNMDEILYILKAFYFEFENEDIQFLDKLVDIFINDISFENNNIIENVNLDTVKTLIPQNHLINLLKSILTIYFFFIRNISKNLYLNNNSNPENNVTYNSNLNTENQIKSNVNDEYLFDNNENNKSLSIISKNIQFSTCKKIDYNKNSITKNDIDINKTNIKNHLFSLYHFLKKILINQINDTDVVNFVIVLSKNLFSLDNELIKNDILTFVKRELTNFCFEYSELSIKNLADLFLKINKNENFYYIPERLEFYLKSEEYNLCSLKFINHLFKLEKENFDKINHNKNNTNLEKFSNLIFKEEFTNFIDNLKSFLIPIDYKNEIIFEDLSKHYILNKSTFKYKKNIQIKHEILKYNLNLILYKNSFGKSNKNTANVNPSTFSEDQSSKLKKFTKEIFQNINYLIDNKNQYFIIIENKINVNNIEINIIDNDSDGYIELNPNISKLNDLSLKNNLKEKEIELKNNFIKQLNIIDICKYINLIFYLSDNKYILNLKNQIRLSNLALSFNLFIRNHLLKKIEKILTIKNSIYNYLNIIQILISFLNEPDKDIKKRAIDYFGKFLNFIFKKFSQYKEQINENNKNYFYYYKYIPESYITYLIMYIIFNPYLIVLFSLGEKKYFQNLINVFMKILKKSTNNNYDSYFMISILIQIKEIKLLNTKNKFISCLSINNDCTYLNNNKNTGKVSILNKIQDNFSFKIKEFNFGNLDNLKNNLCDMVIQAIMLKFSTKIRNNNLKPLIPSIFYSKEILSKNNFDMNNFNNNLFNNQMNNSKNLIFLNLINENNFNSNNLKNENYDFKDYENCNDFLVNQLNQDENNSIPSKSLTLQKFVNNDNIKIDKNIKNKNFYEKKEKNILEEKNGKKENNKNLKLNKDQEVKIENYSDNDKESEEIDEFDILPYYKKYKNKNNQGIISNSEFNFFDIEHSEDEIKEDINPEEDNGNFEIKNNQNKKIANNKKKTLKKKSLSNEIGEIKKSHKKKKK